MPNFVAVELNENVMVVACSKGSGKSFQINQLFEIPLEENSSDGQLGESLKDALAQRGVTKSELIGVVNRKQVEMREVSVPPAPDNELPDLVRFQARNVFASMSDSWKLDYVPFDERDDAADQKHVLAIAIAPQLHDRFATIAETAGLKLKRIVFGPYSCCGLYESLMNDQTNRLLIVPAAGHFDFTVATGPNLVAARSVKSAEDADVSARQVIGEVRRTIASTKSALGQQPVEQILMGAAEKQFGDIGDEIKSKLDLPVTYMDVFATLPAKQLVAPKPQHPEHFAAVIGSLTREYSSRSQPVDFVNPRKPFVRKTNFKPLLIGAAAMALIALSLGAYAWFSLRGQNQMIEAKRIELEAVKKQNAGSGNLPSITQMTGEVEQLDNWQVNRTNWLDELSALSKLLLTPDDIKVTSFRGEPSKTSSFRVELGIRTTKETNKTPAWKQSLFERYDVKVGDSTPDEQNKDYPFSSRLTLNSRVDTEKLVKDINDQVRKLQLQELEAESNSKTPPVAEESTDETTQP